MTRLPDPDRSRAVLIGTGAHTDGSGLSSLPAIGANLAHLRQVLTDPATGSLPSEHCITAAESATASQVGSLLARVAQEATDLLFVYYGGHGLVDDRGRLHLALSHTDAEDIRWTALPFENLREELVDSPAAIRVLVLDCCFSGRAIEAMTSGHSTVAGQIDVAGTYTLASTSANAVAYAPEGAAHTAFTGALLAALRGPVPLNLDDLFGEVRHDLAVRGLPRPQRRAVDNAGDLVLVRPPEPAVPRLSRAIEAPPAAWPDPDDSAPPRPQPTPARPAPRPRLHGVAVAALLLFQLMVWLVEVATERKQGGPGSEVLKSVLDGTGKWFFWAFMLTFAAALPVAGRLSDVWGRRRVFAAGAGLFCVAGLFGPLASTATLLLASRVFQGAGAALGTVGAIALVAGQVRLPWALGLLGVTVVTGSFLGRLLGGEWFFSGNRMVLLGIPALLTGLFGLTWCWIDRGQPERGVATARQWWATAGVSLWMCGFAYVIERLPWDQKGWTDPTVVIPLAVVAVVGVAWALGARKLSGPDVRFRMLAGRQWAGVLVGTAGVGGILTVATGLLWQGALSWRGVVSRGAVSTVHLAAIAAALCAGLAAPFVRRRFGSAQPVIFSMLLVAIGLFWLSRLMQEHVVYWAVLWPVLLVFIGGGFAVAIFAITALADVSISDLGAGSAMLVAGQWVAAHLPASALFGVAASIVNTLHRENETDVDRTRAFFKGASQALTVGSAFQLLVLVVCALAFRHGTREPRERSGRRPVR
ncbi:caspase, EACC1-associated type [Streptomyces yunnanensis]|uniref:Caspase domain-containing protein n=1 Tax=Streptomyces yunnanensis TaxID=156453 RepID=A0A9X8QVY3_9ACTN|nr:MFS transporter [Streptomyces yunnanensis]SHM52872.1 Caspase domain-containing protein [Streptomyces yunnanensis]